MFWPRAWLNAMPWPPTTSVSRWPFNGLTTAAPTSYVMFSLAAHCGAAIVCFAVQVPNGALPLAGVAAAVSATVTTRPAASAPTRQAPRNARFIGDHTFRDRVRGGPIPSKDGKNRCRIGTKDTVIDGHKRDVRAS